MRIACPACNAAYQVPDDQLSEGRVVRCARCGSDWAPIEAIPVTVEPSREREAPAPAPIVEAPPPEPELVVQHRPMAVEEEIPIPRPPVPPKPLPAKRGSALLATAWVLSLAVWGAAAGGLYIGRERVIAMWPPSIRAYALLGLATPPAALSERRE